MPKFRINPSVYLKVDEINRNLVKYDVEASKKAGKKVMNEFSCEDQKFWFLIKLITRKRAHAYPEDFKVIFDYLTDLVESGKIKGDKLAMYNKNLPKIKKKIEESKKHSKKTEEKEHKETVVEEMEGSKVAEADSSEAKKAAKAKQGKKISEETDETSE